MRETRLQAYENGTHDGADLAIKASEDVRSKLEDLAVEQQAKCRKYTKLYDYWTGFLSAIQRRPQAEN